MNKQDTIRKLEEMFREAVAIQEDKYEIERGVDKQYFRGKGIAYKEAIRLVEKIKEV